MDRNLKALQDKAAELRRRMSADKAAAIVSASRIVRFPGD